MKISISVLLLVLLSPVEGSTSGLDVARCRAHCLSLASQTDTCWSACHSPCAQEEESEGAKAACHWLTNINRVERVKSRKSEVWQLSQPLTVTGCEVRWGELEISRNSFRSTRRKMESWDGSVSVLLGLDRRGKWLEISQSQIRGLKLHPGLATQLVALRLMVVGEEGVRMSQDKELDSRECGYRQTLTPTVGETHSEGDLLVRLSLHLPESEPESNYLVRYQQLPLLSSVLGSLVVTSHQFDLTLVRDRSFIVQVENLKTGEISRPLVISTQIEDTLTSTITFITVFTISILLLVALSVMLYRRSYRHTEESKVELNNNQSVGSTIILDPKVVAPLHLNYNNIC